MEPDSSKYHALLARALASVAPLRREAIEHFEKAVEIDPWNATVRFRLAVLYEEMKLPWRARPHYLKILEVDTDNAKVLERLRLLDSEPGKSGMGKRSFMNRIFRHRPK
jgi:tetratricopeptide (TPR) repeat protein